VKVKCLTTFLDGKDRFEKDDIRSVPDEDAARFIANAWAEPVAEGPTSLDIKSVTHKTGATHG